MRIEIRQQRQKDRAEKIQKQLNERAEKKELKKQLRIDRMNFINTQMSKTTCTIADICRYLEIERSHFTEMKKGKRPMNGEKMKLFIKITE